MVTIEQKVLLFSKLIDQLMNNQYKEGLKNLEQEYHEKFEKNKLDTDIEVKKIINNANKKRDLEAMQAYSNAKIEEKKQLMIIKEKCFSRLMKTLNEYIIAFINSEKYKDYLEKLLNDLSLEKTYLENITVYVTKNDYDKYLELLTQGFKKLNFTDNNFKIISTKDNIIGGFILEDNVDKLRINLSIKALLEENEPYIMHTLFKALEVGENNDK